MALVQLRKTTYQDQEVNRLWADTNTAVLELSQADQPNVVVVQATKSQSLTGDEDYVLVDMSGATQDIYLLLPNPGSMTRAVTVKLTRPGKPKLYLKGSDAGQVLINSVPFIQVTDSVKVVATPTAFWTV